MTEEAARRVRTLRVAVTNCCDGYVGSRLRHVARTAEAVWASCRMFSSTPRSFNFTSTGVARP